MKRRGISLGIEHLTKPNMPARETVTERHRGSSAQPHKEAIGLRAAEIKSASEIACSPSCLELTLAGQSRQLSPEAANLAGFAGMNFAELGEEACAERVAWSSPVELARYGRF